MRDFLWDGSGEGHMDQLVSWEVVFRPRQDGGLRLRYVESKDISLIGKWFWRYPLEPNSLWHIVIKSKYENQQSRWDAIVDLKTSSLSPWKDISQVSHIFFPLVNLKVGVGDKILFWWDH